jgi:hypothetical protein
MTVKEKEMKTSQIYRADPVFKHDLPNLTIDDGTSHTAEVTASTLFEAVAQGLSALRKNEWVEGIEERFGFVKVSAADVRVELHHGCMESCSFF